MELNNTFTL